MPTTKEVSFLQKVWLYLSRAMLLYCPTCGKSPLFIPLRKIRKLRDWFTPLDGCPRCGYPYEREPGYFLMAIWAINYGVGSLLGIVIYLFLEMNYTLPIWKVITLVMLPIICFNIFFARHAKAIFLAFDLFCDPHKKEEKGDNDNGGNRPSFSETPPKPDGTSRPLPLEKNSLKTTPEVFQIPQQRR